MYTERDHEELDQKIEREFPYKVNGDDLHDAASNHPDGDYGYWLRENFGPMLWFDQEGVWGITQKIELYFRHEEDYRRFRREWNVRPQVEVTFQIASDCAVEILECYPPHTLVQFLLRDDLVNHLPSIDAVLQGMADVRSGAREEWRHVDNVTGMSVKREGVGMWLALGFHPNHMEKVPLDDLEAIVRRLREMVVARQPTHCLTCGKPLGPDDDGLGGDCSDCMDAAYQHLRSLK